MRPRRARAVSAAHQFRRFDVLGERRLSAAPPWRRAYRRGEARLSLAPAAGIRCFTVSMKGYISTVRDRKNPVPRYWKRWESPPSTLVEVVRLSEPCQLMEPDVMAVVKGK